MKSQCDLIFLVKILHKESLDERVKYQRLWIISSLLFVRAPVHNGVCTARLERRSRPTSVGYARLSSRVRAQWRRTCTCPLPNQWRVIDQSHRNLQNPFNWMCASSYSRSPHSRCTRRLVLLSHRTSPRASRCRTSRRTTCTLMWMRCTRQFAGRSPHGTAP